MISKKAEIISAFFEIDACVPNTCLPQAGTWRAGTSLPWTRNDAQIVVARSPALYHPTFRPAVGRK
jgi:hypothetical protein